MSKNCLEIRKNCLRKTSKLLAGVLGIASAANAYAAGIWQHIGITGDVGFNAYARRDYDTGQVTARVSDQSLSNSHSTAPGGFLVIENSADANEQMSAEFAARDGARTLFDLRGKLALNATAGSSGAASLADLALRENYALFVANQNAAKAHQPTKSARLELSGGPLKIGALAVGKNTELALNSAAQIDRAAVVSGRLELAAATVAQQGITLQAPDVLSARTLVLKGTGAPKNPPASPAAPVPPSPVPPAAPAAPVSPASPSPNPSPNPPLTTAANDFYNGAQSPTPWATYGEQIPAAVIAESKLPGLPDPDQIASTKYFDTRIDEILPRYSAARLVLGAGAELAGDVRFAGPATIDSAWLSALGSAAQPVILRGRADVPVLQAANARWVFTREQIAAASDVAEAAKARVPVLSATIGGVSDPYAYARAGEFLINSHNATLVPQSPGAQANAADVSAYVPERGEVAFLRLARLATAAHAAGISASKWEENIEVLVSEKPKNPNESSSTTRNVELHTFKSGGTDTDNPLPPPAAPDGYAYAPERFFKSSAADGKPGASGEPAGAGGPAGAGSSPAAPGEAAAPAVLIKDALHRSISAEDAGIICAPGAVCELVYAVQSAAYPRALFIGAKETKGNPGDPGSADINEIEAKELGHDNWHAYVLKITNVLDLPEDQRPPAEPEQPEGPEQPAEPAEPAERPAAVSAQISAGALQLAKLTHFATDLSDAFAERMGDLRQGAEGGYWLRARYLAASEAAAGGSSTAASSATATATASPAAKSRAKAHRYELLAGADFRREGARNDAYSGFFALAASAEAAANAYELGVLAMGAGLYGSVLGDGFYADFAAAAAKNFLRANGDEAGSFWQFYARAELGAAVAIEAASGWALEPSLAALAQHSEGYFLPAVPGALELGGSGEAVAGALRVRSAWRSALEPALFVAYQGSAFAWRAGLRGTLELSSGELAAAGVVGDGDGDGVGAGATSATGDGATGAGVQINARESFTRESKLSAQTAASASFGAYSLSASASHRLGAKEWALNLLLRRSF